MDKQQILRILTDWNYWGNYNNQSIERRDYLDSLEKLIKTNEVTVVKGVRRSGKSTILSQFINKFVPKKEQKNALIVNFEDPRFSHLDLNLLNQIYEIYLEELLPDKEHYVILDEVQEINGWERFVLFLHEAKRVNVFVTGSSSKLLSEEYSTLLSGRHVDLEIFPLSFSEYLLFHKVAAATESEKEKKRHIIKNLLRKNLLRDYVEFGSFPKVTLISKGERPNLLIGYFQDILVKDIQKRFKIRDYGKLEELAKYYLVNIASMVPLKKVKNAVNLSLESVERFVHYFETAQLFYFIPKFSFSRREQILNPKKVYAKDLGIRNVVAFRSNEDHGRLMENVVCSELMRRRFEVYYFRSKRNQKEVDFVVKDKLKVTELIQVCYDISNEETKKREISALFEAQKELNCDNLTIITHDYEHAERFDNKDIHFIPLWKWLL